MQFVLEFSAIQYLGYFVILLYFILLILYKLFQCIRGKILNDANQIQYPQNNLSYLTHRSDEIDAFDDIEIDINDLNGSYMQFNALFIKSPFKLTLEIADIINCTIWFIYFQRLSGLNLYSNIWYFEFTTFIIQCIFFFFHLFVSSYSIVSKSHCLHHWHFILTSLNIGTMELKFYSNILCIF